MWRMMECPAHFLPGLIFRLLHFSYRQRLLGSVRTPFSTNHGSYHPRRLDPHRITNCLRNCRCISLTCDMAMPLQIRHSTFT